MHPALQPYLDPRPVRTWRYLLAGAFVGLLGSRIAIELTSRGPVTHACFGSTPAEEAEITTKKLAFEAYPQWRSTFWNGATCPGSLSVLLPWVNNKNTLDPWGTEYSFWCGRTAAHEPVLHVTSAGPDGQIDTDDDIGSEL